MSYAKLVKATCVPLVETSPLAKFRPKSSDSVDGDFTKGVFGLRLKLCQ
mgnify:CR=1 FL=1